MMDMAPVSPCMEVSWVDLWVGEHFPCVDGRWRLILANYGPHLRPVVPLELLKICPKIHNLLWLDGHRNFGWPAINHGCFSH